ncbi:MAG TPA: DNA-processing protein DprA [Methylomirabilota bacterium]|nr:DNA-processing protein DprA [Methylomirabilota bacterium]
MTHECIHDETGRDRGAPRAIERGDAEYPALLLAVPTAPPTLHVRGALLEGDTLAVAVVGSRRATPYGLTVAETLAADLAARGVTIVSGLARGIDTAAHRGALRVGGRTIAVLGSGADVVYPPENARLAEEIVASGALVSQFAPGTPPLPHHFPTRNAVIAGLSLAVVVVEAAERSGSLITARLAAELGREVLAMPGRATASESRGANRLIQDGAALALGWEDVAAALPERWKACLDTGGTIGAAGESAAGRAHRPGPEEAPGRPSAATRQVLSLLGEDPVEIDHVIERSGLGAGPVSAALLDLELEGRVRQIEGKRFVRVGRA